MATYSQSGSVTPTGAVDGVNTIFTLPQAPLPVNSLAFYKNGQLLPLDTQFDRSGLTPYTLNGKQIEMQIPPQPGDRLVAFYSYSADSSASSPLTASGSPIDLTTVDEVKDWINTSNNSATPKPSPVEISNIQRCITAASRYWLWRTGRGSANWQMLQRSPFNEAVEYTETYDGNGNDLLFLRNCPALSIAELSINGRLIGPADVSHGRGYLPLEEGNKVVLRGMVFDRGRRNVAIRYTAGFQAIPITGEVQAVPSSSSATFQIQVQQRPWLGDIGIAYFADGSLLSEVKTSPNKGEYFISGGGVYTFSAEDAGEQLLLSYQTAGTPSDVRLAVTQMVAVNYKRRQWIDQASQDLGNNAGTVSYRSWELPPEVVAVMNAYARRSL